MQRIETQAKATLGQLYWRLLEHRDDLELSWSRCYSESLISGYIEAAFDFEYSRSVPSLASLRIEWEATYGLARPTDHVVRLALFKGSDRVSTLEEALLPVDSGFANRESAFEQSLAKARKRFESHVNSLLQALPPPRPLTHEVLAAPVMNVTYEQLLEQAKGLYREKNYDEIPLLLHPHLGIISHDSLDVEALSFARRAWITLAYGSWVGRIPGRVRCLGLSDKYATASININPTDVEALWDRAGSRSWLENYEGAIQDYSELLLQEGPSEALLLSRGATLRELGHYELALGDFTKAVDVSPNTFRALSARGSLYRMLAADDSGRYKEYLELARLDLQAALEAATEGTIGLRTVRRQLEGISKELLRIAGKTT